MIFDLYLINFLYCFIKKYFTLMFAAINKNIEEKQCVAIIFLLLFYDLLR